MPNIELLDKALANIDAHPEEWNQGTYGRKTPCDTAGCLAYHVGVVLGAKIEWEQRDYSESGFLSIVAIDGREPATFAKNALEISYQSAGILFAGGNNRTDLQDYRDALARDGVLTCSCGEEH